MIFLAAVTTCFEKYARFRGRASRAEFWYFSLFYFLGTAAFIALEIHDRRLAFARIIFSLGTFLPMLSVTVRRLHDIGRSGWWYFIVLVPFGAIVLIVWYCRPGAHGPNQFGDPDNGSPAEEGPAPAWTASAAARIESAAAQTGPAAAQTAPVVAQGWPQRVSTGPRGEFGRRQYQR